MKICAKSMKIHTVCSFLSPWLSSLCVIIESVEIKIMQTINYVELGYETCESERSRSNYNRNSYDDCRWEVGEIWFRKDYILRICAKSTKIHTFAYSLFIYVAMIIELMGENWINDIDHIGFTTAINNITFTNVIDHMRPTKSITWDKWSRSYTIY